MNPEVKNKLDHCLFKNELLVDPKEHERRGMSAVDYETRINDELKQKLADFIIKNHPESTEKVHTMHGIKYATTLFVCKGSDFVPIVEGIIQDLSMKRIQEIRSRAFKTVEPEG